MLDEHVISINEKNWFGNERFAHKGSIYRIENIIAIKTELVSQRLNFAPTYFATLYITTSDGKILKYRATSAIIRTKKYFKMEEAIDFISKKTFTQRLQPYLNQINDKGYFQYHDYIIYGNGDIKHKNKTINIADESLKNGVSFGRKSSFGFNSYYTPDEVWMDHKVSGKILRQVICIKIKENRDVISSILMKLAELKGGEVSFKYS